MNDMDALISGFRSYRGKYMHDTQGGYRGIADYGPHSRILMIACCDSRADPAIITNSSAGELMVIRNMANLVPPWSASSDFQETGAALEFAVGYLQVEHIVVLGHSRCGGIRSLLTRLIDDIVPDRPLDHWMAVAEPAARRVLQEIPDASLDDQACACSRRALLASLDNLQHYPGVAQGVQQGKLELHGWYFNLASGELENYDSETAQFNNLL
jgi:carbonic anhydrase